MCRNCEGLELAKIMWIRAGNSEHWLENRQTFTNSLAVMSMVGYILGLGDRHPNNIVIDRHTGKQGCGAPALAPQQDVAK